MREDADCTRTSSRRVVPTALNKCSAVAEMGDRLATIDMGRKEGAGAVPPSGGSGSPSSTMSPGLRHTSVSSGILIHLNVWPHYNVTDRQAGQRSDTVNRSTNGRPTISSYKLEVRG